MDGFWRDKRIRGLTEDGRTLALYALTCSDRSSEGFYALAAAIGRFDLQWDQERWAAAWRELAAADFAEYDDDAEVVFIVRALKHHPPKGSNRTDGRRGQIPGAVSKVAATQQSPRLFARFLESADKRATEFAHALREHYGLADTKDPFA